MSNKTNTAANVNVNVNANEMTIEQLQELLNAKTAAAEKQQYAAAVDFFNAVTANTTVKYSKRDAAAVALLLTGKTAITAKDIKAVLRGAGCEVSDTGNQYTQGLPQLLNTAAAVNVKLTITAERIQPAAE